ncbi:SdpI family protein [Paractinoplanes atraurantiacus]|uniref:SdpI/YhfL protein family protein n=1 Tax=Paractinoplanes atraurantiacus TaxID=1036182 RepID=A0A285IAV6_9ACTN|nr:SdpI family protein [Actinoplanes atraurantiacus]SNY44196.1 SdpI/YhfL protein family protein [Actinoplanes atraurantiacus]
MAGPIIVMVAGVLVAAAGLLGWLGKLPRNSVAGVRTASTMRSERAFTVGNRVAGPAVVAGGLAAVAGGVLALVLDSLGWVLAGVAAMVVLVVAGGVAGSRAAARLDD